MNPRLVAKLREELHRIEGIDADDVAVAEGALLLLEGKSCTVVGELDREANTITTVRCIQGAAGPAKSDNAAPGPLSISPTNGAPNGLR